MNQRNKYIDSIVRKHQLKGAEKKAADPIRSNQVAKNFACLASDCPETCCSGWSVGIDRKTHHAYKNAMDPNIRLIASTSLKRTRTPGSPQYSKIMMNDEGRCPFLTPAELCGVQQSLGESALSQVCTTFPRDLFSGQAEHELYVSPGCPAVSMELVSNPQAADSVWVDRDGTLASPALFKQPLRSELAYQRTLLGQVMHHASRNGELTDFAIYSVMAFVSRHLEAGQADLRVNQSKALATELGYRAMQDEASHANLEYQLSLCVDLVSIAGEQTQQVSFRTLARNVREGLTSIQGGADAIVSVYAGSLRAFRDTSKRSSWVRHNFFSNELARGINRATDIQKLSIEVDQVFFRWVIFRYFVSLLEHGHECDVQSEWPRILWVTSRALGHNPKLSLELMATLENTVGSRPGALGLLTAV